MSLLLLIITGCQKMDLGKLEGKDMSKENRELRIATFAGGCFGCIEADFEKLPGVVKVISGYTGKKRKPYL